MKSRLEKIIKIIFLDEGKPHATEIWRAQLNFMTRPVFLQSNVKVGEQLRIASIKIWSKKSKNASN